MKMVRVAVGMLFILFLACESKQNQQIYSEDATFQVQGPIEIDTSYLGSKDVPYDRYHINLQKIQKEIYIMTSDNDRLYPISSYGAIKHVDKDSFYVATGVYDRYSEKLFKIGKEKEYTFSFYLPQFDFRPDTIFLDFVYYMDSLFVDRRFVAIPVTKFKSSY